MGRLSACYNAAIRRLCYGATSIMIFRNSSARMRRSLLFVVAGLLLSLPSPREAGPSPTAAKYMGMIRNGTVWKDTDGSAIWCNGGHMIRQGDTFYWVGYETKPRTGFRNIKLYSSTNLADWRFENNVLRRHGPLSILGWAGRPGLLHNRSTKKYVLIIEADSQQWERHKVGFA